MKAGYGECCLILTISHSFKGPVKHEDQQRIDILSELMEISVKKTLQTQKGGKSGLQFKPLQFQKGERVPPGLQSGLLNENAV